MSIARHHAEWLSLLDISGPFLSMPVLLRAFPQGLNEPDPDLMRTLRLTYEEWLDDAGSLAPDPALHHAWVRWVLGAVLEMPDAVIQASPDIAVPIPEYGETLRPDFAIVEPDDTLSPIPDPRPPARLLVWAVPPGQDLEKPLRGMRWKTSPATRMMTLLHASGVRLGLLTNGEQWMLVDAPKGETTGFISWYARLWLDEPLTLRAFRTLLEARRFFGVPDNLTLEALLAESVHDQQEVTDQLGFQVRRAVEVLVQALDLADEDHGRTLLPDVSNAVLYEAALTVMMRLVVLLCAEERDLLLLGDPIYDENYAVSTLRAQLREMADEHSEELLERRFDAWGRLLATFRAVHGGIRHDRLTLPAYGGSLFDPQRFPFLESIRVHSRTVLHLLEALQILQVKVPGGGPAEARRLSFRALDIEQIGHVYEGLLDHTAVRASAPVLGLAGTKDREPEIALADLEAMRERGTDALVAFLKEQTGRSESALRRALDYTPDRYRSQQFRIACGNDEPLYQGVLPFAGLLRDDDYGRPLVIPAGSVYVTSGTERRATGTHYTPRSLTEPIVQHTLEPLVYHGPAEGLPREQWRLRSSRELLDLKVCDMAMGSGAFLVQACRYLAERLLEAEEQERVSGMAGIGDRGAATQQGGNTDGSTDVPRPGSLAEEHGHGGRDIPADEALSEGRAVRPDQPDSAGERVGSGEHRGGVWATASQGISQSSVDSAGVTAGSRDTSSDSSTAGISGSGTGETRLGADAGRRQDAATADQHTPGLEQRVSGIGDRVSSDPTPDIPDIPEDDLVEARRRIADRCLYGVDKNPLAVEMAKLSLWLVTMQKGRPFTFLDHALKCGDSLLGVSVDQLRHWSLAGNGAAQQTYLTEPIRRALLRSLRLRCEIQVLPVKTVRDAEIKAEKLQRANEGMALVKLAADLLIAAELHPDAKQRVNLRGNLQMRLLVLAESYEDIHAGRFTAQGERPGREAFAELRAEADRLLGAQRPFHWELEFPEVFIEEAGMSGMSGMSGFGSGDTLSPIPDTRGFAALVGNPPFQGGQRITGALGVPYRDYLVTHLAGGKRGSADLCAYFFLRGRDLLRQGGGVGLLATNTIAQGDTREVGLDQLAHNGFSIPRAVPSRKWPGTAAVEVAHVWLRRGPWQADYCLDDATVAGITPYLTVPGKAAGTPYTLAANAGKSFQGSIVLGMGFVLEPEEAQALIARDPRNKDVLFPYLNGQDLNSSPEQAPSRWVINFFDWPLERAEQYPDCMAIVREKVKPEREKNNRKVYRDRWWHYAEKRPELYATIAGMERVLVRAEVSTHPTFTWRPTSEVFSHMLIVWSTSNDGMLSLLHSSIHSVWTFQYASTLGRGIRYTPSDCFETFPFPEPLAVSAKPLAGQEPDAAANSYQLNAIGSQYHEHRRQIMLTRQEGLTKTYNRFHEPEERADDIATLRRLHTEMDAAVAAAYGWHDLDLGHGFHETKQGTRYTISEAARREVLDRLLALNHQRHAAEVAAGLHEKGKKKGAGRKGKPGTDGHAEQGELL